MKNIAGTKPGLLAVMLVAALIPAGCSSNGGGSAGSCSDACAKAAALNCPNAPAVTACQQECEHPTLFVGCETARDAFYSCVKNASSFVCDSGGAPQALGCDKQSSALSACLAAQLADAGFTTD